MTTTTLGQQPLTPVSFLERASAIHADRVALVEDDRERTYRELAERCRRLAGALHTLGIERGDVVSVLAPNTGMMLEAHFGVPGAGAVLNALNIRLLPKELAQILAHAESRLLLVDHEYAPVASELQRDLPDLRVVVGGTEDAEYERLLAAAAPRDFVVENELDLLALNYTSGTTGRPKGVMYCHRGAYLQALAMAAQSGLESHSVFLWTLPMFHCNGWCFPWAVTARGGTHVALRRVDPAAVWQALRTRGVTHFNAAPTVLVSLAYGEGADAGPLPATVRVATGGAPPSPTLLERLSELGMEVTHMYGLTETYGPAVVCEWHQEWNALPRDEQARLKARQGVVNLVGSGLRVVDEAGRDVPMDGTTLGEVLLRGNNVMLGYYKDDEATRRASMDGWFRTGDIGVLHPDGYVELKDRAKDIIVTGGENVASIEVEQAIAEHPAVLECAVVAAPSDRWGETPFAYVSLRPGATVTEDELVAFLRERLSGFKVPRRFAFGELPKTATGKIQKFLLRERLWADRSSRIG